MKKILFLVDNWFGDLGGKKKVILMLANALIESYDISFLTIDTKISREKIKDFQSGLNSRIRIVPHFFKRDILFYPKLFIIFGKKLKNIEPDIVICGGGGPHSNAFFGLIAKAFLPKIKIIFIDQGNPSPLLKKQNFLVRKITKMIYKKIDKSISVSKELSEHIKTCFKLKKDQCSFVYNCVNPDIFKLKSEPIEEKIFDFDLPFILTACRLDLYSKDFKTLIEAYKIINSQINCYLVIIGDGPDRDKIKKMVDDLKLTEKVLMLGYQKNPYKWMKKAKAFVLSSFFEGFSLVLVEAMACDCPVVSSDCDFGPREIIDNGVNGFLVPVGDAKLMAQRIVELLKNENLRQDFIRNSQRTIQKFSFENMIAGYKKIIQEVLKNY